VQGDELEYFCNNRVSYTLRGIHVEIEIHWDFEAQAKNPEQLLAGFRGGRSRVELRLGKMPELYVVAAKPEETATLGAALRRKLDALAKTYPGLALEEHGGGFHVMIPDALRAPHEAHFALVCGRFLDYVRNPRTLPSREKPNMLAKYYVTTKGIELARRGVDK
jgi:hypothetical protein